MRKKTIQIRIINPNKQVDFFFVHAKCNEADMMPVAWYLLQK